MSDLPKVADPLGLHEKTGEALNVDDLSADQQRVFDPGGIFSGGDAGAIGEFSEGRIMRGLDWMGSPLTAGHDDGTDIARIGALAFGAAAAAGAAGAGGAAGGGSAAGGAGAGGAASGVGIVEGLKTAATILTPALSLASAATGAKAARTAAAAAGRSPALTPPMPSFGGPNTIAATRGSVTEQLRRRGRASTIMTAPQSEALGAA